MIKRINDAKAIIINDKTIKIECLENNKKGIKFKNDNSLALIFNKYNTTKEIGTEDVPIKIITKNNKIWTLFNCFYVQDCHYIHLTYNEIVKEDVPKRNFKCNKICVKLNEKLNYYCRILPDDLKFEFNDMTISYINKEVVISSINEKQRDNYYECFIYLYELFYFIFGFFFEIKNVYYISDKTKIFVENELPSKYISNKICEKKDLLFINKLDNNFIKEIYENYIKFHKTASLQLDFMFISLMEENKSYTEIIAANLIQILDGIYDKLDFLKPYSEEFSKLANNDIKEKINEIDFSEIKKKYNINSNININEKINNVIQQINLYNFRKRLKKLCEINRNIFQKEYDEKEKHIKFNKLINKFIGSRNKISHVDNNDIYLEGIENLLYIHKLILLIRLLIFKQLKLDTYINKESLESLINSIDEYIENNLDN